MAATTIVVSGSNPTGARYTPAPPTEPGYGQPSFPGYGQPYAPGYGQPHFRGFGQPNFNW